MDYVWNVKLPGRKETKVPPTKKFAPHTIGHESDVRVAALEGFRIAKGNPVPDGATAPVEPSGITTLAIGKGADICCFLWDYFLQDLGGLPANVLDRVAEVIYCKRPDGGRVFNGGAVANGAALYYDYLDAPDAPDAPDEEPVFAGLMRNVLRHFLD